jgi:hypothetical protein
LSGFKHDLDGKFGSTFQNFGDLRTAIRTLHEIEAVHRRSGAESFEYCSTALDCVTKSLTP